MKDSEIINYIDSLSEQQKYTIWIEYMVRIVSKRHIFEILDNSQSKQFPILGVDVIRDKNYVERRVQGFEEFTNSSNKEIVEYKAGNFPELKGIYYYYRARLREAHFKKYNTKEDFIKKNVCKLPPYHTTCIPVKVKH